MESYYRQVWLRTKKHGPWLLASLALSFVIAKVGLEPLKIALAQGPSSGLVPYVFVQVLTTLAADGFATRVSLSVVGLRFSTSRALLIRGTSYLAGLLNYGVGQGAVGYYLYQNGVKSVSAVGTVFFMILTNLFALVAASLVGACYLGASPLERLARALVLTSFVGFFLYLTILKILPRRYLCRPFLAPLASAGVRGHLWATLARLPHVIVLVVGHWGAMRLWGIAVPFSQGVSLVSLSLLIAALPVSPNGLGTIQATQVLFFSRYAESVVDIQPSAIVLAFSLAYYCYGVVAQAAVGCVCLALMKRSLAE